MNLPMALRTVCSCGLIVLECAALAQFSHAQALTTATIMDPAFGNMKALTVTIPSGWQFQGTVARGPDCYPNAFPTFRAYSHDARQIAMIHAQGEQIQQTMNRNHEAFMAQQESQFQSAMKGAGDAMNARTTAASDWVDYSLDQQTVNGSGGLAKVSSSYSQTWSNGQNQWFQTNNPNSDPNGTLNGNWTRDTKVHGNGQPY